MTRVRIHPALAQIALVHALAPSPQNLDAKLTEDEKGADTSLSSNEKGGPGLAHTFRPRGRPRKAARA